MKKGMRLGFKKALSLALALLMTVTTLTISASNTLKAEEAIITTNITQELAEDKQSVKIEVEALAKEGYEITDMAIEGAIQDDNGDFIVMDNGSYVLSVTYVSNEVEATATPSTTVEEETTIPTEEVVTPTEEVVIPTEEVKPTEEITNITNEGTVTPEIVEEVPVEVVPETETPVEEAVPAPEAVETVAPISEEMGFNFFTKVNAEETGVYTETIEVEGIETAMMPMSASGGCPWNHLMYDGPKGSDIEMSVGESIYLGQYISYDSMNEDHHSIIKSINYDPNDFPMGFDIENDLVTAKGPGEGRVSFILQFDEFPDCTGTSGEFLETNIVVKSPENKETVSVYYVFGNQQSKMHKEYFEGVSVNRDGDPMIADFTNMNSATAASYATAESEFSDLRSDEGVPAEALKYMFVEWNTMPDGSGTSYKPGQNLGVQEVPYDVTKGNGTFTLYAIYELKIRYNTNTSIELLANRTHTDTIRYTQALDAGQGWPINKWNSPARPTVNNNWQNDKTYDYVFTGQLSTDSYFYMTGNGLQPSGKFSLMDDPAELGSACNSSLTECGGNQSSPANFANYMITHGTNTIDVYATYWIGETCAFSLNGGAKPAGDNTETFYLVQNGSWSNPNDTWPIPAVTPIHDDVNGREVEFVGWTVSQHGILDYGTTPNDIVTTVQRLGGGTVFPSSTVGLLGPREDSQTYFAAYRYKNPAPIEYTITYKPCAGATTSETVTAASAGASVSVTTPWGTTENVTGSTTITQTGCSVTYTITYKPCTGATTTGTVTAASAGASVSVTTPWGTTATVTGSTTITQTGCTTPPVTTPPVTTPPVTTPPVTTPPVTTPPVTTPPTTPKVTPVVTPNTPTPAIEIATVYNESPNPVVNAENGASQDALHPSYGANGSGWALVNLLAALVTLLMAIFLICSKKEKEEDEDEESMKKYDAEGNEIPVLYERKKSYKVVNALVAAIAIIFFILTEDITQPMRLIDKWTVWMLVIMLVSVLVTIIGRKWFENTDDEDEQAHVQ